jgi:hypothetical protein
LAIALSVLLLFAIVLYVLLLLAIKKDRQHNSQKEGQTTQ